MQDREVIIIQSLDIIPDALMRFFVLGDGINFGGGVKGNFKMPFEPFYPLPPNFFLLFCQIFGVLGPVTDQIRI